MAFDFDLEQSLGLAPKINELLDAIPDESVLSCTQIAELMNVHVKTIRRWIKNGQLDAYGLGGRWAVFGTDFKTFLQRAKARSKYVQEAFSK